MSRFSTCIRDYNDSIMPLSLQPPTDPSDDVELAMVAWVCWFTTVWRHGTLDDVPLTEYEAVHYLHGTKAN